MTIRLQRDIEGLKRLAIELGTLVEERFRLAMKAVESRDDRAARKVIEGDIEIDQFEVDVEEACLKVLALHQPVADQLRYIVSVLKMNNDLERIGDLSVNIAQHAKFLAANRSLHISLDYFRMSHKVDEMLKNSLDSLVNTDVELAYQVCAADDEVDRMKHAMQAEFAERLRSNQDEMEPLIDLFLISRHLERIADHATNIAEDVIYIITGEIHRHRGRKFGKGRREKV